MAGNRHPAVFAGFLHTCMVSPSHAAFFDCRQQQHIAGRLYRCADALDRFTWVISSKNARMRLDAEPIGHFGELVRDCVGRFFGLQVGLFPSQRGLSSDATGERSEPRAGLSAASSPVLRIAADSRGLLTHRKWSRMTRFFHCSRAPAHRSSPDRFLLQLCAFVADRHFREKTRFAQVHTCNGVYSSYLPQ